MSYFYISAQITFGLLSPFFLFYMVMSISESINIAWKQYRDEDVRRLLLSRWVFIGKSDCRNKDYTDLRIRNVKTGDELTIACEKKELS